MRVVLNWVRWETEDRRQELRIMTPTSFLLSSVLCLLSSVSVHRGTPQAAFLHPASRSKYSVNAPEAAERTRTSPGMFGSKGFVGRVLTSTRRAGL